jgi:hypothetical protein
VKTFGRFSSHRRFEHQKNISSWVLSHDQYGSTVHSKRSFRQDFFLGPRRSAHDLRGT